MMEHLDSIKHPVVKAARELSKPSGRQAQGRYLIEGEEMIRIAITLDSRARAPLVCAFFDDSADPDLAERLTERGIPVYLVSQGLLFKLIGTGYETDTHAVGVVEQMLLRDDEIERMVPIVIADRIQDPRNLGMLIRTAEAVGASVLIVGPGCADPYSRACVRSTTGSILCLPLCVSSDLLATIGRLREIGGIIATSAHAQVDYLEADLIDACAFIFGNETTGVSAELRATADLEIAISVLGSAHSLNVAVAAGIILYEHHRQVLEWAGEISLVRADGVGRLDEAAERARKAIGAGDVIAFPTDTVFGLGCDAANDRAAQWIYRIKDRPADQPLILMSHRADLLLSLGAPSAQADALAARFWPGPLTIVVPIRPTMRQHIAPSAMAGGDTIGLRVPDHPVALAILAACSSPLATTSANLSGQPPAANAGELAAQFRYKVSLVVSGGPLPSGLASTVLDLSRQPPVLLRSGAVSADEIKTALGMEIIIPA